MGKKSEREGEAVGVKGLLRTAVRQDVPYAFQRRFRLGTTHLVGQ